MTDLDRETVGRMVLPVFDQIMDLIDAIDRTLGSTELSRAERDELRARIAQARAYFAPAKQGA